VALKVSEGVAQTVRYMLRESLKSTIASQVGSILARNAFKAFKKRLDYSEYGGAPLLGVKGACIVCHGSSNANAIKNALRVAAEYARAGITRKIEHELAHLHHNSMLTQTK
jgi:phosphate acyltransferase